MRIRQACLKEIGQWSAAILTLTRPLLGFYLVFYMVFSVSIQQELWQRGGHVTLEQWAYHALLDGLGYPHHHHGNEEAASETPAQPTSDRPSVAVSLGLSLLAPPPDFLQIPFDGILVVGLATLATVLLGLASLRRIPLQQALPDGLRRAPPTPPPPSHR